MTMMIERNDVSYDGGLPDATMRVCMHTIAISTMAIDRLVMAIRKSLRHTMDGDERARSDVDSGAARLCCDYQINSNTNLETAGPHSQGAAAAARTAAQRC